MNKSFALAALALLLGAAGCKSSSNTTTTTSSTTRTTDTFTGTVPVGGHDFHSFTVSASGQIDVTLTAATPPSTVVMGLSIGTPGDGVCPAVAGGSVKTAAGATAQLSGIGSPGTLCVDVKDAGGQTATVSYTVTVLHP